MTFSNHPVHTLVNAFLYFYEQKLVSSATQQDLCVLYTFFVYFISLFYKLFVYFINLYFIL